MSSLGIMQGALHSVKMKQKFLFLCGNFEKINCIYAIKFTKQPWHYFEEVDSISDAHNSLPPNVDSLISSLNRVRTIEVHLDEEQTKNYYNNGKFIFKGKELKTFLQLSTLSQSSKPKAMSKDTSQLVFIIGQTNPMYFLDEFEKCHDVKSDKDKMFKIRNFVHETNRVEFSEFFFTSNWPTVKEAFLKKYSKPFTTNKKKELNIDFDEETSLRSFVERKLKSLETYTSLPYINQVEMMLYDLPIEIANLFLVNEKMKSNKTELLEFCDSIQDLAETMLVVPDEEIRTIQQDGMNQMEIFNFDPDMESDDLQSDDLHSVPSSSRGSGRGRGRGRGRGSYRNRGRPSKMSNQISDSVSSCSDMVLSERESVQDRVKTKRGGKAVGDSPTGTLISIDEDSVLSYFNAMSDGSSSTVSTLSTRPTRSARLARSKPYMK